MEALDTKKDVTAREDPATQDVNPNETQMAIIKPFQSTDNKLVAATGHGSPEQAINIDKGCVLSNVQTSALTFNTSYIAAQPKNIANLIRNSLVAAYQKMRSNVSLPWMQQGVAGLELLLYKMNMVMLSYDADNKLIELTTRSTVLENIFDHVQDLKPSRTVLNGSTSYGLYLTLLQLCYDWSRGLGPAAVFKLVVLLDGLQLKNTSLDHLIIKACHTDGVSNEEILKVIRKNLDILIILHDLPFEDMSCSMKASLHQLLQSKIYAETPLLVASHQWNYDSGSHYVVRSTNKSCTKFVTIQELNEPYVTQFLNKNLLKDVSTIHFANLKSQLFPLNFIRLQDSLFLLFLINAHLQENVKDMGSQIDALKTAMKWMTKDVAVDDIFNVSEDCASPQAVQMAELGGYILRSLANNKMCFTREEIVTHCECGPILLKAGLFVPIFHISDDGKLMEVLEPVHRVVCYFLIAHHLHVVCLTKPVVQLLDELDLLAIVLTVRSDYLNTFPIWEKVKQLLVTWKNVPGRSIFREALMHTLTRINTGQVKDELDIVCSLSPLDKSSCDSENEIQDVRINLLDFDIDLTD